MRYCVITKARLSSKQLRNFREGPSHSDFSAVIEELITESISNYQSETSCSQNTNATLNQTNQRNNFQFIFQIAANDGCSASDFLISKSSVTNVEINASDSDYTLTSDPDMKAKQSILLQNTAEAIQNCCNKTNKNRPKEKCKSHKLDHFFKPCYSRQNMTRCFSSDSDTTLLDVTVVNLKNGWYEKRYLHIIQFQDKYIYAYIFVFTSFSCQLDSSIYG
jgi:hypothetical protein